MLKNTKKQTRCPYCSAVYNVSINQLTVSKGWVRCADCRLVFNAVENLYQKPQFNFKNSSQQHYHEDDIRAFFHKKTGTAQVDLLEYLNDLSQDNNSTNNEQEQLIPERKFFAEYRLFVFLFIMVGCALIIQYFNLFPMI